MPPKRHHIVPQFFLRRFAAEKDIVRVVARDDFARAFETNVENALVQAHFYTIETAAGRDTGVEDELFANHVEPNAARALRRVIDEGRFPPMPGLREVLSTFFAFQYVRGEAMRAALVGQYEALAKMASSHATAEMVRRHLRGDDGREPSEADVQDTLRTLREPTSYCVRPRREANAHVGALLEHAPDMVRFFEERHWQLVTFPGPMLITGDEPIGLVTRSTSAGDEALGIGNAPEIVIPTDPSHALILARPDTDDRERELVGTAAHAQIINLSVGYGCHRFVVHRPGTDPLRGLSLPAKGQTVRVRGNRLMVSPRPARRRRGSARGQG